MPRYTIAELDAICTRYRSEGFEEGRASAWNSTKNEVFQAKLKLLQQIGNAMEMQSRAMEYFTRNLGSMEDLFK